MNSLSRSQKIKLAEVSSALQLQVALRFDAPNLKFDFSCFGLDEARQLSNDRYFIFFNQTKSPENALQLVKFASHEAQFLINLARLPASVNRLVFVATVDGKGAMNAIRRAQISFADTKGVQAQFVLQGDILGAEKALIVAEIYLKSEWRVAAVGQGFVGGLSAILVHFGGEEDDATPTSSPAAAPPAEPNACARCGKEVGFWRNLTSATRSVRRCGKCAGDVKRILGNFRHAFLHSTMSATLSDADWKKMRADLTRERVLWNEGLAWIRGDAMQLLERNLAMAAADGIIEPHEEREFNALKLALEIPPNLAAPLNERMESLKELTRIRQGHLPSVTPSTHFDSGEICHLEGSANFHKVGARAVTIVPGRLLVTNKKIHFLSPLGGWTIQYKNVMRIENSATSIYLELATKQGNGRYDINDAARAEAIIDTVTRLNKRQLMLPHEGRDTRSVPHHVRTAVWQRDGGKCKQCSSKSYLEFDHIIPWSEGGATSENNLQLLCRRCNGEKGNKI